VKFGLLINYTDILKSATSLRKFGEQFLIISQLVASLCRLKSRLEFCGRPFGGVLITIKDSLRKITKTVRCSDRYVIVKVGDCIFVDVCLRCVGSTDRQLICDNVVLEIGDWCSRFSDCNVIVRGDFNVDIVAFALSREICSDQIIVSSDCLVTNFSVIDPDINFSDHLPLRADIKCLVFSNCPRDKNSTQSGSRMIQRQLRWDQADLVSYYFATGDELSPLLARVDDEMLRYSDGEVADDDVCDFCRVMLCISAVYAVMRCLSVRPSVCHVHRSCQYE